MWADDDPLAGRSPEVTLSFTGSTDNWEIGTTKLVDEKSFKYGDYTIKRKGTTGNGYRWYNSGYLLLGKEGATLTLPAFNFDVDYITIEGTSGASTGVKQNIYVGNVAVSSETTGAKNVTNKYAIDENYQAAGNVYILKVTSDANTQISKINIYKKVVGTLTETSVVFAEGYATTGTEGSTIDLPTATVMAGEAAVEGATVTWKSSDENVAKIEGNKISLLTPGTATITASYAGNGTYKSSKTTYELTVPEVSVDGLASMAIIFKDSGNDSDSSTKVTSIDKIISKGSDYVSAIPTATNVYNGRTGRGLKLGASGGGATLKLTLAKAVKPIKITFDAMQYNTTETSITVNGKAITNLGNALATYSIIYDGKTEVSEISISTPA